MNKLPLNKFHEFHKAQYRAYRGWIVPQNYKPVEDELHMVREKAGLFDMSFYGKLMLKGRDTIDFLQRISTNDLNQLEARGSLPTIFCNEIGRLIDYARLNHFDEGILAVSSYYESRRLKDWIERFIIMEDVRIFDATNEFLWLLLIGPESPKIVEKMKGEPVRSDDDLIFIDQNDNVMAFIQNDRYKWSAYQVLIWGNKREALVNDLYESLVEQGGGLIGLDAAEVLRIEAGIPEGQNEINDKYNPHEARLLHAVSFTKESYTGQEIIARLDTYDKVQKYTMVVELQGNLCEALPAEIMFDGAKIGELTSCAYDPDSDKHFGLAYVKKRYALADFRIPVVCGEFGVHGVLHLPISADET